MRNLRRSLVVAVLAFSGLAGRADAGVMLVTSPGALSPNDSIDWGQFGPDGTVLNTSEAATSAGGLGATVSTADPTGMQRLQEGPLPATWTGNFTVGDALIASLDINYYPLTITFAHAVRGAGAQIQQDAPGAFIATIEAFNGSTSLGVFNENGTSNQNEDGSAIFIGVLDTNPEITKIVFGLKDPLPTGQSGDFAINRLRINSTAASVPEPGGMTLIAFGGMLLLARAGMRRLRTARGPR